MLNTTTATTVDAQTNLTKNIETERLEKNIESIISGSLPYYKSIFKQMLSANYKTQIHYTTFY
jgi:hypothetical protein